MSQHAKTVVAAVAAVLLAGVQTWQTVVAGGPFRLVYLVPIAVAVVGAVLVHVIPNVPASPTAKAIVAGVLAALNAVSTVLAGAPANVTALNLVVAGLGALLVWYVPELGPELAAAKTAADVAAAAAAGRPVDAGEITDALRQLEALDPAVAATATVELPAVPALPAAAPVVEPTPIADALAAAATVVLPAIAAS